MINRYFMPACCGVLTILVGLILILQLPIHSEAKITQQFTESGSILRTMAYDPKRQRLYVGDKNSVHALNGKDLSRIGAVLLGPKDDHLQCSHDQRVPCPPGVERESTDTISQILLYDDDDDTLIACGTIFYGSCEHIDLDSLILKVDNYNIPAVSNDPNGSVVAFYVPKSRATYGFGVVYVGSSYSSIGIQEYRSKIHFLSARRASTLDFLPRTRSFMDVLTPYMATFPVEFVSAFEHSGYAYFLVTRKENLSTSQRGTFLFRICLDDFSLQSLVELPLKCSSDGSIYGRLRSATVASVDIQLFGKVFGDVAIVPDNLTAIYGLFTMDQSDSPTPRGASAICMFSMKEISEAAKKVVQNCADGKGFTGPSYLTRPVPCVKKNIRIPDRYCGIQGVSYPVSDASPLSPTRSLTLPGTTGMSLQINVVNEISIATVGTADGRIVQAILSNGSGSSPGIYRETTLDKTRDTAYAPVKQLLFAQLESGEFVHRHIYALTDRMVYQVQLSDCESHSTCTQCIKDPYCGWCASSNRCTPRFSCLNFWLKTSCPFLRVVEPRLVSRDIYTGSTFAVIVSHIPTHDNVFCVMEDTRFTGPEGAGFVDKIPAKLGYGFKSGSYPRYNDRGSFTCGPFRKFPLDGDVTVNLTLKITIGETIWATDIVGVYDCTRLTRCSQCAVSMYPCKWCVERHACMPANRDCTSRSGNPGVSILNVTGCPSIEVKDNSTLLVADGTNLSGFNVTALNMMRHYRDTLQCRFKPSTAGRVLYSKAKYTFSTSPTIPQVPVTCDPLTLSYPSSAPYVKAEFDLVWENDLALDNPQNLTIRVYKCRYLVNTCGQCLTLAEGYTCGWCKRGVGQSSCTERGECMGGGVWMNKQEICSDPTITAIKPVGGPLKGGTLLTINGTNLGKVPEDLEITVAEKPCLVQREGFVPSTRVLCRTTSTQSEVKGSVIVTVSHQHTTPINANSSYHYMNPIVVHGSLKPKLGPVSGGTRTTIQGRHLDHGSTASISVNGLHAKIIKRTSESIIFLTPRVSLKGEAPVTISIDSMVEYPLNDRFRYVPDPTVIRTEPMHSLFSGGTEVQVIGTGLDAVQEPRIIVHHGTKNKTGPCKIKSPTTLECITPNFSDVGFKLDENQELPVGWIMDNVTGLVYIKVGLWVRRLTYYPDPEIFSFKIPVDYTESKQILEIKGTNMDLLKQFSELEVLVGGAQCWIDKKNIPDILRCRMPEPDDEKKLNDKGLANIVVLLGNYRREIGYVRYLNSKPKKALVLGLVFGLVLPLIIIGPLLAAFLILRRRKHKKKSAKVRKSLPSLLEMDVHRSTTGTPRHTNPYSAAAGNQAGAASAADETVPLKSKEEDISILADDDKQYFQELLKRMSNQKVKSAAREIYIERERLELGNLLGKGHFGRVYAATLRDEKMKHPQQVAVKTIEDQDLTHAMMEKFLEEGISMKNFDHPHVLSLIGMCLGYRKEPMVILPFMDNGDLRTFVKDRRRNFTARQLLLLTQQVAEGMAYLSSLKYVHRDLAARNCMIDSRNVVKVADFGLSHQLYDKEYYSSKDPKSKLPIKWMALESLEEFVFTVKSDVWSFGVLTWELMTRGVTPYPDVEVFETRNYLASGRRLRQPKYCPDNVYGIMMDCWDAKPEHRPTFGELVNRIEALLNPSIPAQPGDQGNDPLYLNLKPRENQDYLKPINPDSSFANTDSSFYPEAEKYV